MEKTAAVTVGLLWLLFLLAFPTSRAVQGNGNSSSPTFLVSADEVTGDFWTTMQPMPTARSRLGVAVVNGKIYAIGGYNGSYLNTNEMYDPATDTWTTKKPMPTPRCDFGIAVYQNKIYCIGGEDAQGKLTGVNEVYDPLTDTWETRRPMPTPRAQLDANVVNGKIYLIGGRTSNPYPATFLNEVYDPLTDLWTTKAQIPNAVMEYASAVVNNKIYIISGGNYTSLLNLTQIYDPETDTWSYGKPIPIAIQSAAAGATTGVAAPKRIYVIGGGSLVASAGNENYDPEKDVWSTGTSMPTSRRNLGVAVVDDILYAIGGDPGWVFQFYGTNEQYTPIGYVSEPRQSEPFPTALVVAASGASVAIIGIGLLIYFKKRNKGQPPKVSGSGGV